MARSTGMAWLAFVGIVFPAAFADLLVLGISTSLTFDPDPAQAYIVMRKRDTTGGTRFRLLFQSVTTFDQTRRRAFVIALSATSALLSTRRHRM
jgi:hypothetical protein